MARKGEEMTEIKMMPLDDNRYSNGSDYSSRPASPYGQRYSYRQTHPNDSDMSLMATRPAAHQWHNDSYSEHHPQYPPSAHQVGSAYSLMPPRPHSYANMSDSRSGSPYPASGTPFRSQETLRPLFPDSPSGYFKKDWVKDGSIAQLHSRDDKEFLSGWKRKLYWFTPFVTIITLFLYWAYFIMRIKFVVDAQHKNGQTFPLAWVFIVIELTVAVPIFMHNVWNLAALKPRRRPKLRLVGNDVPNVDVFITCCGEDDDLVLDTTRAACDLDYPQENFRVLVLDDGKSDNLEQAIRDLSETYPNVFYKRRPKFPGVPHHFKAGNLNFGLDEVHTMPGGAAPFMAALDADMIPEQSWLRAVLPHLLADSRMALACPPQLFYNVPAGDPLGQSLDFFVHISEPIKDTMGVAWCTGSGYIIRREAIDEIGGFPCGSLAEDVATSTMMLGRGWKTAFVHEPLQFGTVPDDYASHLKQRTRWAIGTVDTSIKLKFCLWGDAVKKMTFAQRTSSFMYAFLSLFNIFLTISLFALPIVLMWNKPLVAYATENQLRWLIRLCFAANISNRINEFLLFIPAGYGTGQRGARYQLWMSPYIGLTLIRSFILPKWLGGQAQAFKPTGSLKSAINERDAQHRAPMFRRLWTIVINYMAGFHVGYVYFTLAAVVLSTYRCVAENFKTREMIICLITHAFWPPIPWVMVVAAFWIPITYACDPPTMPDREQLLNRDPKTGVAHPTKRSKKIAFQPENVVWELEYTITTIYTTVVFVGSFFF